ncbi:MAG TPA: hypothetical protein VHS97_06100 [Isosphaeraceae bacterium]|nr:hypothetical protein [Isosphaeraceae bacterium]
MCLPRMVSRRWTLGLILVCVLFVLTMWTVRPEPVLPWFGMVGLGNETPLTLLRIWAGGHSAPMTPVGLVSLFPAGELVLVISLIVTLLALLILFRAEWHDLGTTSWSTQPIHPLRHLLGMKVRTLLVVIAVIGLELGWEIVTWRSWGVSEQYRARAGQYAENESRARESLRRVETMLAGRVEMGLGGPDETPAARSAEKAFRRDELGREHVYYSALIDYLGERKRVYEAAAEDTSLPIPPGPPRPGDRPGHELGMFLFQKEYAQALAHCAELIEHYPDLVQVHERRAWILSTCPDANHRDGKLAVESATRAAELTNWKNPFVLSTLAAAYAEAGNFASAVRWEEEVQRQYKSLGDRTSYPRERLALYKAGKPYRMGP